MAIHILKYDNILDMRKAFITLLLSSLLTICSCSDVKNDNAIHSPMSLEKNAIELTAKSVDYMIENDYSFSLLLYTSACSFCDNAKESINQFVKDNHYAFYQIEMYDSSIEYLVSEQSQYFNKSLSYPLLYIFKQGELTYQADTNTLNNSTTFSRVIKPQLISTNIWTATTLDSLISTIENNENFLVYTYDSGSDTEKDIYNSHLYPLAIKSNKNVLILDKNIANSDLISYISSNNDLSWSSLIVYENGQIKTTLGYDSASGNEIDNLLNSFFNINSVNSSR